MQGSLDTGTAWPYYRPESCTLGTLEMSSRTRSEGCICNDRGQRSSPPPATLKRLNTHHICCASRTNN